MLLLNTGSHPNAGRLLGKINFLNLQSTLSLAEIPNTLPNKFSVIKEKQQHSLKSCLEQINFGNFHIFLSHSNSISIKIQRDYKNLSCNDYRA